MLLINLDRVSFLLDLSMYPQMKITRRKWNMSSDFANVIEKVIKLPGEDKEKLKTLPDRYLIEERREEIFQNYKKSLEELQKDELKFSNNIGF